MIVSVIVFNVLHALCVYLLILTCVALRQIPINCVAMVIKVIYLSIYLSEHPHPLHIIPRDPRPADRPAAPQQVRNGPQGRGGGSVLSPLSFFSWSILYYTIIQY